MNMNKVILAVVLISSAMPISAYKMPAMPSLPKISEQIPSASEFGAGLHDHSGKIAGGTAVLAAVHLFKRVKQVNKDREIANKLNFWPAVREAFGQMSRKEKALFVLYAGVIVAGGTNSVIKMRKLAAEKKEQDWCQNPTRQGIRNEKVQNATEFLKDKFSGHSEKLTEVWSALHQYNKEKNICWYKELHGENHDQPTTAGAILDLLAIVGHGVSGLSNI